MKLTLKERRFLIVWILINAFALFVNVAEIEGDISTLTPWDNPNYKDYYTEEHYHVFMTIGTSSKFWPFTTFYKHETMFPITGNSGITTRFYGIFNSYNGLEFLIFLIVGFTIIWIPKLWNYQKDI